MGLISWYSFKSKVVFDDLVKLLEVEDLAPIQRLNYIKCLIRFARVTGRYMSPRIESVLCQMAEQLDTGFSEKKMQAAEQGKVLHVATRLKSHGGHSRLLERWIELDQKYNNDVVVLDPQTEIPERLQYLCQSKGTNIIACKGSNDIDRAQWLRRLASEYEHIVLHVNHNEVIHMLAFGTPEFTRPILLMNHTDHLFWLGVKIADCILNMSSKAKVFTNDYRGRSDSVVLPIPLTLGDSASQISKADARREIGVPNDVNVIFSCGHFYKYSPISFKHSFHWILFKVLFGNKKLIAIVVGIKPGTVAWRLMRYIFGNRLILKASCNHAMLNKMLYAADLYIDSYPISGFTALCEALAKNIPILPVDTGFSYFDSLLRDAVKPEGVVDKIPEKLREHVSGKDRLYMHLDTQWVRKYHEILKGVPNKHALYELDGRVLSESRLSKTFFHQFGGQLAAPHFLKSDIPLKVKIKVLIIMLKYPTYLLVSLFVRFKVLVFKALF